VYSASIIVMTNPPREIAIIELLSDDEGEKRPSNALEPGKDGTRRRRKRRKVDATETTRPLNDEPYSCASQNRTANAQKGGHHDLVLLEAGDSGTISYGILERLDDGTASTARTCLATTTSGPQSSLQHVQQPDRWSCGFRNMQMMLTGVIPHLPPTHAVFQRIPRRTPHATIPSLLQLQRSMEEAWGDGFDPKGAEHYRWKMVGKRSWIGAVDVATLLCFLGLDATVVQFIKGRQSRELLPKFVRAHFEKLNGREGCPFCPQGVRSRYCADGALQWASLSVGEGGIPALEPACSCPVLPLYLQWEGHSVTVVGIEADGTFLAYDPLKRGDQILTSASSTSSSSSPFSAGGHRERWKPIRLRQTRDLVNKDTQIVLCTLHSMSKDDRRRCVTDPNGIVVTAGEWASTTKR
jgi:Peptidase family C78